MGRKKLTIVVLMFLVFTAIGCGNTTETAKKEVAKDTPVFLQEILKRGKVIVGTEATLAPFEFVENEKIVGYGADILQEIVKVMGVELEQHDVLLSGVLTGLDAKKFDFAADTTTITPERAEKFGLTTPIADASLVFLKRKGDTSIQNKEDIHGKIMGCQIATSVEKKLIAYDEKRKAEGKEGFKELKIYQSFPEIYMDLKNGRIDILPQMLPIANYLMKQEPDAYEIIEFADAEDITGGKRYSGWATRKDDKELLEFLNTEILKMKKSGKLAELQMKWFGTTWELPDEVKF